MNIAQAIALPPGKGGCNTGLCDGLTDQLIAKLREMNPGLLVPFPWQLAIYEPRRVNLFLQGAACKSLISALDEFPGRKIRITSMLRSLPQQLMVYRWNAAGRCGIPKAAPPGKSRHEQGRCIDTPDAYLRGALAHHGWVWFGDADTEHYTHDGQEIGGQSVRAFQTLWNEHNTSSPLVVDGSYGPRTEVALLASPAGGWP